MRKLAARATKVVLEASVDGVGVQSLASVSADATEALRSGGHWRKASVVWKHLFVAGGVAAAGGMDVTVLSCSLFVAAVLGNNLNYWISF